MLQMLSEQVYWISPKHIYSSTAFQKAYPGSPRRRAELPAFHVCHRQAATRQHPPPTSRELWRKDEKSKGYQPSPGTWGTCLWFCWRTEICAFPARLCFHSKQKWSHPRCLLPPPPPISCGTHIPGPSPHPSSVSAALNTYSSTCIRSRDDPTRGPQDFKNSSRSPRRPAPASAQTVVHLLQARGWKIPVPLAHQPRGAKTQDITFPSGSIQKKHGEKEPFDAIKTT